MDDYSIRSASDIDLADIRLWLKQEFDEVNECGERLSGFWHNINIIEKAQQQGNLAVLVLQSDDKPIVFCVSYRSSIDLFEVKIDHRGRGYGRKLAEYVIAEARKSDSFGMIGQCKPENSEEFWKKLGFERTRGQQTGIHIYLAFRGQKNVAEPSSSVKIQLSTENNNNGNFDTFETRASLDGTDCLLEDEFVEHLESFDTRVTIWIDGKQLFAGKVKYAEEVGVELDYPWVCVRELFAPSAK